MNTVKYKIERETTKELRSLGKEFINTYHSYIKWADRPSRKLYWNLYENDIMVGVFALGSAFIRPKIVSDFMISNNLIMSQIANNIVFCMANQKDKNAGTSLLSLVRKDAIKWWYERYGDYLKCFQTFILPPRTGAIYKADNWQEIGMTSGYSQKSLTIRKSEYENNKEKYDNLGIKEKIFKSGEIRYILNEYQKTDKKLIFMKINTDKEIRKCLDIKNI